MLTIIKSIVGDVLFKFINAWRKDKQLKDLGAAEVTIGAVEKVNEAKQKVLGDINKKKESLNNEINKEIKAVEREIESLKNSAPEKINKIAKETSADLVKKLIDADVNKSSISAIVESLSKKNKDKYNVI